MAFDVTRRNVLKSVAGVAGASMGVAGLSGAASADTFGPIDIGIHTEERFDGEFLERYIEEPLDDLNEQLDAIHVEYESGSGIDGQMNKDDTSETVRNIEEKLAEDGTLHSFDIHLIPYTGRPGLAQEMGGAGFNVWRVNTSSSEFSSRLAADIEDEPFEREYGLDGDGNTVTMDSSESVSEGNYAFAFVNNVYVTPNYFDQILDRIEDEIPGDFDIPDRYLDVIDESKKIIEFLITGELPNFDQMFRNTIIHETCHCIGAEHEHGTVYKGDRDIDVWGGDRIGAVNPLNYKVSPMSTWYVEDFMDSLNRWGLQDQDMLSKEEMCDADKPTGKKHTTKLSECTIEAIHDHFWCTIDSISLEVEEKEGLDGQQVYQANVVGGCLGADYTWEFKRTNSPEIRSYGWGTASIEFDEPGDYRLRVIAERDDRTHEAEELIQVEDVSGQPEPTETPSPPEDENDDTTGSESDSGEDDTGVSGGYGGDDRNTPVETPDMCTGNICFD